MKHFLGVILQTALHCLAVVVFSYANHNKDNSPKPKYCSYNLRSWKQQNNDIFAWKIIATINPISNKSIDFFFFLIDLFVNGLIVAETATGNYETILENEQTGQTYFL